MGKKLKTGKQRKDKFYRYAKEAGYRSRAAFKLLQLNKKFSFLQTSKVLIDLCAAPGGWLQVASKNMPLDSLILGVDLVPIRPIRNVRTEQFDITTPQCETWLKRQMQTWKADCVLHDGAPNLGSGWEHDAFAQARLTLSSFRVATRFLREGGWFVTKLFRSRDFFKLIWVFEQFFERVHQTKPQASRMESAELFIVCEHYKAPLRFDPAFLDPDRVFADATKGAGVKKDGEGAEDDGEAEVDNEGIALNLLHPEKTKRRAEGYPEHCGALLYRTLNASEFVHSENFQDLLAGAVSVQLDDTEIAECAATTDEIRACLNDIRVLNKRDMKNIMAWRKAVKKELAAKRKEANATARGEEKNEAEEEVDAEVAEPQRTEEDERELVERQIRELEAEEQHASKKKLKKLRERRAKLQRRIDSKMIIADDRIEQVDDTSLFSMGRLAGKADADVEDPKDERSRLLRDAELLDSEMERVANELAVESREQFEQEEDSKFDRMCETREEAHRRKTVRFEKSSTMEDTTKPRTNANEQLAQFDEPVDRRPLEIEAEQQTDFINNRIARFEKQLVALRKLSAQRATVTKKSRKHGIDLGELGKMALDSVGELDADMDETKIKQRIGKLEKMVGDLRQHQLKRLLPPSETEKKPAKASRMLVDEDEPNDADLDDNSEQFSDADESDSDDDLQFEPRPDGSGSEDEDWKMDQAYLAELSKHSQNGLSKKKAKRNQKKELLREKAEAAFDEAARTFKDDEDEELAETSTAEKSVKDSAKRKKVRILTPDELALGEQLANSLKRRREIIDESFHRFAYNDSEMDLPRWFVDDETRHSTKPLPISKEQTAFYRERLRGINARPIKKVIEAKERRKRRVGRLLKKASEKTDAILNADGDELVASTEKTKQIQRLYRHARKLADRGRERTYVAQRRGKKVGGQHVARPGNVKGRFKLVDRRMRKDRRSAGKNDRGKGSKAGKRPTRKGKGKV